jgi:hypothetical protein
MHFIFIFDISYDFCSRPVGITLDSALPEFIVQVNDTNPLWFYCSQTDHCVRGMVFSVNADDAVTNKREKKSRMVTVDLRRKLQSEKCDESGHQQKV